jgi:ubiquitin C-terminal hydrolase
MFGLQNFKGSCWVNACLQCIFRIPEVQRRYTAGIYDTHNLIDECLCRIWNTNGDTGLKEFFESVKTHHMPAGNNIGDSHELLNYLCDKLPYLDELCRFKVADAIHCNSCEYQETKEDTVIEFSLDCSEKNKPIAECISDTVKPVVIEDWKCEKCSQKGCKKQQLIGKFPKVMIFHKVPVPGSVDYPSVLSINKNQYVLLSVASYNGAHWWAYGRNMPPGSSWFTIDDKSVQEHGPKQFPVSSRMRIMIYYRLEN